MNEFGPFSPYGGYVWSSNRASEDHTWPEVAARGAVAAGAAGAAWWGLTRTGADGRRPLDTVAYNMAMVGNESPFQFLHTFRIPEWVSPWTSVHYQGLKQQGADHVMEWGAEVLHNRGSYAYLKAMAGLSDHQMQGFGLTRDFNTYTSVKGTLGADKLVFKRRASSGLGDLFIHQGGQEKLFVAGTRLMQLTPDAYDATGLIDKRGTVNRAFHAIMQSLGLWDTGDFVDSATGKDFSRELFSHYDHANKKWVGSTWAPIIAEGRAHTAEEAWRRSSFLRAPSAFGMERFNRLVGGVAEQIGGQRFAGALESIIGLGTRPGPANKMYWRFGTKAATLVGMYYGVQELDWLRRKGGIVGNTGVSAALSAGAGYFAGRMGANSKVQGAVALGSFAAQMILPGFEKGLWPGIVSTYANANVLRATAGNPFSSYRRTLEGYFPGVTSWQFGAGVGLAVTAASFASNPFTGKSLPQHLIDALGPGALGLTSGHAPDTLRRNFWQNMNAFMGNNGGSRFAAGKEAFSALERMQMRMDAVRRFGIRDAAMHARNTWTATEDAMHAVLSNGVKGGGQPFQQALLSELDAVNTRYNGSRGFGSRVGRQLEGLWAQAKYAFFGVNIHEKDLVDQITAKSFHSPLGRAGLLFFGALGAHQLLTGGLLGSLKTSSELQDIYSGRQLVEINKGRFWEGGGTPFEGSKTSYYRPHYVALTLNRIREKGLWGADEDNRSPLYKLFLKNFTYEWEKEHYWDRPYPISDTAFQDFPIIGGFLSATVGRLIKPAKLMHVNEWMQNENGQAYTGQIYQGWRKEPSYGLGADTPGMAMAPLDSRYQLVAWQDQWRELEGLTGWAKNVISKQVLGYSLAYSNSPLLQDSGRATSETRKFWENQMGGAFFSNEFLRRVFPQNTSDVNRINPIANMMPSWMPENFHYGDPYTDKFMEWGEARLPGAGYEALHPELKGVPQEDYPLIHQYDILAGVAPFSKELRNVRNKLYRRRAKGETSDEVNSWMDTIDRQVQQRYAVYDFNYVDPNAIELPGSNLTQALQSRVALAVRHAAAPLEYLTPMGFRPVQKFFNNRSPIERYEYERLYGTPLAFWDKPWRDWFRPFTYSLAHNMGYSDKPYWRETADQTNAYFDKLEFLQMMRAADAARANKDFAQAFNYEFMASTTLAGTNAATGDPVSAYWAMPQQERSFFNAFVNAPVEDRERILEMVPENEAGIYQQLWRRIDAGDTSLYPGTGRPDRGFLKQRQMMVEQQLGAGVPGEGWIGWNPDVDMDDIKVRYIDNIGQDVADFGMWQSDLKKSMRQEYLDGSADKTWIQLDRAGFRDQLARNTTGGQYGVHGGTWLNSYARIDYNDTRGDELRRELDRNVNGY